MADLRPAQQFLAEVSSNQIIEQYTHDTGSNNYFLTIPFAYYDGYKKVAFKDTYDKPKPNGDTTFMVLNNSGGGCDYYILSPNGDGSWEKANELVDVSKDKFAVPADNTYQQGTVNMYLRAVKKGGDPTSKDDTIGTYQIVEGTEIFQTAYILVIIEPAESA